LQSSISPARLWAPGITDNVRGAIAVGEAVNAIVVIRGPEQFRALATRMGSITVGKTASALQNAPT